MLRCSYANVACLCLIACLIPFTDISQEHLEFRVSRRLKEGFKEITSNISSDENSKTSGFHMAGTLLGLPVHFNKNNAYASLDRREKYCRHF